MKPSFRLWFSAARLKNFSVFLGFAFVLLLLSKLMSDYTKTIIFEVRLKGLEEEVVVTNDQLKKIQVIIKTSGLDLFSANVDQYNSIELKANYDVKKVNNTYVCYPDVLQDKILEKLSNQTTIRYLSQDTLIFAYKKSDSRRVPIRLNKEINFAPNYDLVTPYKLKPDSVKVVGPRTSIKNIKYVSTKPLIMNQLNEGINETIILEPLNKAGVSIYPKKVNVTANVKKHINSSVAVQVDLINVPKGVNYDYEPKFVTINFKVSVDDYQNLNNKDFKVVIDALKYKDTKSSYWVAELVEKPKVVKESTLKNAIISVLKTID